MQTPIKWTKTRKTWTTAQLLTTAAAAAAILYCVTAFQCLTATSPRSLPSGVPQELLRDPDPSWLFDIPSFSFLKESSKCDSKPANQSLTFAVVVHSKPEHFRQRQVIRSTWGSAPNVRLVFLLGVEPVPTDPTLDREALLRREHERHGDLVQGNFVDTYRNLTYKHIMGFKWLLEHCDTADYIIKADDDSFVDIYQLQEFLERTFPQVPSDTVLCNVFGEGSVAKRSGRYAVDQSVYPLEKYPRFCGGLAYVTTASVVRKLYRAAPFVPFLWVDDAYVTGLLAKAVNAKHFFMNPRYAYGVKDWKLVDADKRWPYIVSELDTTSANWREVAEKLWRMAKNCSG